MIFPQGEFAFEVRAQVAAPLDLGETARGHRRIVPILGGTFEGPKIRGRVLPGGADWQILRPDGVAELEARYTLETEAGALVYVQNRAIRHGNLAAPESVYFRCVPVFETSAPDLQWLTRSIFVGSGVRRPEQVEIAFWRLA